jgi:hypothetical protein
VIDDQDVRVCVDRGVDAVVGGGAAVDGDDQVRPRGRVAREDLGVEPVAVVLPRDVALYVCAEVVE